MRLLSAAGDVKEVGYKRYATTEMVELFMTPGYSGGLRHASDEYATTLARMPEYLRERGYKEPTKPGDGPYAYVHGGSIFSVMKGGRLEAFHEILGAIRKRSWLDVYPFQQLQVDEKDSILLVDVGGANGHELKHHAGRRKALGLPRSRLVLQDLPRVTEKIPLEWRQDFEVIDHDFFTPQPEACRGARAYYMRYILHDWPDTDRVTIISYLRDAMRPGYSTLFINEHVLPDTGCSWRTAAFDITMMACLSGKERTKSEWYDLIAQVSGLTIDKFWPLEDSGETLIEVSRS